jgi:hypothetical protein
MVAKAERGLVRVPVQKEHAFVTHVSLHTCRYTRVVTHACYFGNSAGGGRKLHTRVRGELSLGLLVTRV